jgi:hypothetical protein
MYNEYINMSHPLHRKDTDTNPLFRVYILWHISSYFILDMYFINSNQHIILIYYCKPYGIPYSAHLLWDPIQCTPSVYLDYVLLWPDDGSFTAETFCLEVNCKILSYCWLLYVVILGDNKIPLYCIILIADVVRGVFLTSFHLHNILLLFLSKGSGLILHFV